MRTLKQFFKGFCRGFKGFSQNIALIVNTVLLTLVYVIGVGVTSMIAKIFKKQFLEIKLSKKNSYWSDLGLKKKSMQEYYRQF
jgi:hypothetical protein